MAARILVVDDNPANLDLILYLLRAFGHRADGFSDALAAYETARTGKYDLVLTDILMPGIDGYELVRRLRLDDRFATPVVAVTALAMTGDKERIAGAGFDGCITKPIDPQTFMTQIEAYLHEKSSA